MLRRLLGKLVGSGATKVGEPPLGRQFQTPYWEKPSSFSKEATSSSHTPAPSQSMHNPDARIVRPASTTPTPPVPNQDVILPTRLDRPLLVSKVGEFHSGNQIQAAKMDSVGGISVRDLSKVEIDGLIRLKGSKYFLDTERISFAQLDVLRKFHGFNWDKNETEYWTSEFDDASKLDSWMRDASGSSHPANSVGFHNVNSPLTDGAVPSTVDVIRESISENVNTPDLAVGSLNEEQQRVFDYIENTKNNVFITGRAGSGKSFLLRHLATKTNKQAIVVAPTGVAALNANGATIHSTFGLSWGFLNEQSVGEALKYLSFDKALILRKLDLLIIDEVSMVPADMLLALDRLLRRVRETDSAFGGVQVVLFGDPYQLEPVVTEKSLKQYYSDVWGTPYFFSSPAWKTGRFGKIELIRSHRQHDGDFLEALDAIRRGTASFSHLELLNSRQFPESEVPVSGAIRLSPTNKAVNLFNYERLNELPGPIHRFQGTSLGNFDKDMKRVVAPDILEIKVGAQVMMLANDPAKRWVNGSTAEIAEFIPDDETGFESIWVEIDHSFHRVDVHKWKQLRHTYNRAEASIDQELAGEFRQYPMTLGWARTIHKSQGQTYDKAVFDLKEGVFASGQAYVALSRCRTLGGLYLNHTLELADIRVDDEVREFMKDLTPASQLSAR